MKKQIITLLLLTFLNTAFAQWTQKNSMYNYGRHAAVSFSIGDKAYVGLGRNITNQNLSDFWEYNSITDRWKKVANYPGNGQYSSIAYSLNGKGYVGMGFSGYDTCTKDIWEYNPQSNTWKKITDFPGQARYGAFSFVIGDSVFIGGGSYNNSNDYLYDMWMYVHSTNTWTRVSDFPGWKRNHAVAFSFGNYGYVGSGLQDSTTPRNDFWKYNKNTNTWIAIDPLPGPERGTSSVFIANNKAYIGMGAIYRLYDFENTNDFYRFNPAKNSWDFSFSAPEKIISRRYATSFNINNKSYLVSGYTEEGILSDLWEFDPTEVETLTDVQNPENSKFSIEVYPNPSNGYLKVKASNLNMGINNIEISSTDGKLISQHSVNTQKETTLDVRTLPAGVYLLKLKTETGDRIEKFIIE